MLPLAVSAGLKYGLPALGVLKGLFGGKSPAQKRLERIAKLGYDPEEYQRALTQLNQRIGGEKQSVLSRLRAGNVDPSSGIGQELLGSVNRSYGMRAAEAKSAASESGQRATELLGTRDDESTGDLLGSLLASLASDFEEGGLFDRGKKQPKIPAVRTDAGLPKIRTSPLLEANPLYRATLKKRREISDYGVGLPSMRMNSLPRYLR